MRNILEQELYDAIVNYDGKLHNNSVAKNIYDSRLFNPNELDCMTDEDLISNIFAETISTISQPTDTSSSEYADYRYKSITLLGVKNYPYSADCKYTINFQIKNETCSAVILGKNGVGKTSFYSSLEFISLGKMFTAALCGTDNDVFLRNKYSNRLNVSINLRHNHGEFLLPSDLKPIVQTVPAHFCSAWDVVEIEKTDNLTDLIYTQLGLDQIIKLRKRLQDGIKEIKELYNSYSFSRQQITNILVGSVIPSAYCLATKDDDDAWSKHLTLRLNTLLPKQINYTDLRNGDELEAVKRLISSNSDVISSYSTEYENLVPGFTLEIFHEIKKLSEKLNLSISSFEKGESSEQDLTDVTEKYNSSIAKFSDLKQQIDNQFESYSKAENRKEVLTYFQAGYRQLLENDSDLKKNKLNGINIDIDHCSDEVDELNVFLENLLQTIVNEKIAPQIKDVFIPIMNSILEDDELQIEFETADTDNNISIKLKQIEGSSMPIIESFNAKEYLNTFRIKLFTVAFKFALSCSFKAIYHENWPFVLDDVFDSSDFDNRIKLRDFINKLITCYNQTMRNANTHEYPLQLIFFTQDDIIGDSVFHGLKHSKQRCRLCRLHPYKAFEEKDINKNGELVVISEICRYSPTANIDTNPE